MRFVGIFGLSLICEMWRPLISATVSAALLGGFKGRYDLV